MGDLPTILTMSVERPAGLQCSSIMVSEDRLCCGPMGLPGIGLSDKAHIARNSRVLDESHEIDLDKGMMLLLDILPDLRVGEYGSPTGATVIGAMRARQRVGGRRRCG